MLAALLTALGLHAAELGDAAKPLDIKDWVKGSAVDLAAGKGKTIYVVEFWATWCPPCRTSIPHLTEMQKQFKDRGVVFIGVTDEKTDVVKKFVDKMGDQMNYTVAVDAGKTSEGYMAAYGATGIPHAFVVDKDGKVVWEGHPMDGLDKALEQIVAGKYDMTSAKKRASVQTKLSEYVELTLSGENPEQLAKLEAELVELEKDLGNIVNGEKFDPADIKKRIQFGEKAMKYQQLLSAEASDAELAALEKDLEANAPKGFDLQEFKTGVKKAMAQRKESMEIQKLFSSYADAVGESGDAEKATELGKQLAGLKTSNPDMLSGIAWTILTDPRIKNRDTKLALGLAKRAVDATESKEASVLDTYARALYETGDKTGAIAQQKKAIELVEDEDAKVEMKAALARYEGKTPAAK
jgi:thiol-disulfide isomerase/thioredoxin/tetratricopeptide (TPR) repeat protein